MVYPASDKRSFLRKGIVQWEKRSVCKVESFNGPCCKLFTPRIFSKFLSPYPVGGINPPLLTKIKTYQLTFDPPIFQRATIFNLHCKDTIPKLETNIPRNETVRPQSFSTFIFWWTIIYSHDRSAYSATGNMWPILGINKSLTDTWTWKLGLRPRNSQKRNT